MKHFFRFCFSQLYGHVAKPLFFLFDAELVHHTMIGIGEFFGRSEMGKKIISTVCFSNEHVRPVKISGMSFPNRVGLAAGFDYEARLTDILPAVGFGFATLGTVTLHAYAGNEKPRLGRFPRSQSLLVNKGFKSPGAKAIIRRLEKKHFAIPIGISIGSTNKKFSSIDEQILDICTTFSLFEKSTVKHAYYELNISCPNTKKGQPFTTTRNLHQLLSAMKKLHITRPIFVKMPIDLNEKTIFPLLVELKKSFVTGVIFGNLTKDKENPDVNESDREEWKKKAGNLSGKPTWNRSNTWIRFTRKHFGKRFVIIGTGGIFTVADAKTKIACGADIVQLITGMIYEGPQRITEIAIALANAPRAKRSR